MNSTKLFVGAIIGLIVIVGGFVLLRSHSGTPGMLGAAANVTTIGNPWAFTNTVSFSGALSLLSSLKIGSTGTAITRENGGFCNIQAGANTIAATTTQTVDCVLASPANTALTGVTAGDRVFLSQGTTTPTTAEGLTILGESASSTPGYITLKLFNGTGTTFTWTAAASSSWPYLVQN